MSHFCTHIPIFMPPVGSLDLTPNPLLAQSTRSDGRSFCFAERTRVKLAIVTVLPTQTSPKHSVLGYVSGSGPSAESFSRCGKGIREENCSLGHPRL